MDDQMMAELEALQKKNQAEMDKAMRDMGMDPAEFAGGNTYADPELAELDRELRKRGKLAGHTPQFN